MHRRPPKGEVWAHIDWFDNEDQKVWAVQWWQGSRCRYQLAKQIVLRGVSGHTRFFGEKAKQPKAVFAFRRKDVLVSPIGTKVLIESTGE